MVASDSEAVSLSKIAQNIYYVRGQKVMLDSDLARLYRVETKALNRAVLRNRDRFPADFMFQLTGEEEQVLRCQIGTLKTGRGKHRKFLPYVFTEQGVAMLSSVCGANAPFWSMLKSFAHSFGCAKCFHRMPTSRESSLRLKASTIANSVWCSMRFAN